MSLKNEAKFLILSISLIMIDQITKILTIKNNSFIKNTSTFYNLISNQLLIIIISIIILIFLFHYLIKSNYKNTLEVSLVSAGIISNVFDRILYKGVIDFISISKFPLFNLADSFITMGAILLIIKTISEINDRSN